MKQFPVPAALLAVSLSVCGPAAAQPVQPVPTASTPVATLLASAPQRTITNVLMTARLATAK